MKISKKELEELKDFKPRKFTKKQIKQIENDPDRVKGMPIWILNGEPFYIKHPKIELLEIKEETK